MLNNTPNVCSRTGTSAGAFVVALMLFAAAQAATAEIIRYTDRDGNVHYTSSVEQVPEEYRSQIPNQKALPPISKTPALKIPGDEKRDTRAAARNTRVEIFVTDWCSYCRTLEKFLKEKRIPYVRRNIEADASAKRAYLKLGGGGIPVTKVGSRVIRGYRPEEILEALGRTH